MKSELPATSPLPSRTSVKARLMRCALSQVTGMLKSESSVHPTPSRRDRAKSRDAMYCPSHVAPENESIWLLAHGQSVLSDPA